MLMDPMVISVLYVWCQHNRDTVVSFWFGTQFKAMYLPWVLMLFNLIIAGGGERVHSGGWGMSEDIWENLLPYQSAWR